MADIEFNVTDSADDILNEINVSGSDGTELNEANDVTVTDGVIGGYTGSTKATAPNNPYEATLARSNSLYFVNDSSPSTPSHPFAELLAITSNASPGTSSSRKFIASDEHGNVVTTLQSNLIVLMVQLLQCPPIQPLLSQHSLL